jgi:hypothetical protein
VVVTGTKDGHRSTRAWDLVDRYDEQRGITAMMRYDRLHALDHGPTAGERRDRPRCAHAG